MCPTIYLLSDLTLKILEEGKFVCPRAKCKQNHHVYLISPF